MTDTIERISKFSYISVIETIIASSISVFIAWKFNFLWYIIFSSCIAPFLLLRSKESTINVIENIDRNINKLNVDTAKEFIIASPILIPGIILVKFYSAIKFFISNPVHSIKQIPSNYYYNIFVLDLRTSPEFVPGAKELSQQNLYSDPETFQVYDFYKNFSIGRLIRGEDFEKFNSSKFKNAILNYLFYAFIFIVIGIPLTIVSFSFRYCIKSTSIVWLPLLWILYQSDTGIDVRTRMKAAVDQPWFKVVIAYSSFVIIVFSCKMYIYISSYNLKLPDSFGPFKNLGENLLDPLNLPLWQVAGVINAALALVFYNEVKKYFIYVGSPEAWSTEKAKYFFAIFQAVRTLISIYTICCFLYIMTSTAANKNWPAVEFILFPSGKLNY